MQPAGFVDLRRAVLEICARRNVDPLVAQDLLMDAHEIGDITLKFRRPDGSFGVLPRNLRAMLINAWGPDEGEWRQIFERGEISIPQPRPRDLLVRRGAGRRIMPDERCRIFAERTELDALISSPPIPTAPAPKLRGEKPADITPVVWAIVLVLDTIPQADNMQRKPLLQMVQKQIPGAKETMFKRALRWCRDHPL
jgi:hypothetical protein